MSYPEQVTPDMLSIWEHIPDAQIEADIRDNEKEVAGYRATMEAERQIAQSHPNPMERRLADFRATARPGQIAEREELTAFLRQLQSARAAVTHDGEFRDAQPCRLSGGAT